MTEEEEWFDTEQNLEQAKTMTGRVLVLLLILVGGGIGICQLSNLLQ